jgi:hypothetical protein
VRLGSALVVAALGLVSAIASSAATPSIARADGAADLERLRKRFSEGIAKEEDDQWADALEIFREVGKEKMSPQVRFHIALSEEKTGRLVAARAGYQEAIELARQAGDTAADVAENAPKKLAALEPRIPRITIRLQGDGVALLDGEPVAEDRLGTPIKVDPGKHEVAVRRGGAETPVRTLTMEESATEVVNIASAAPAVKDTPDPPPPPEVTREDGTKVPAVIVGSVGLASLVGGAVLFGLRQAAISDVTASCDDPNALTGCDPALQDTADLGRTYEYAAIGLAAGGAALLGAATVLWFTVGQDRITTKPAPAKSAEAGDVSVTIGPTGVLLRGRF